GTDILLGGNAEFLAKQELLKKGLARSVGAAAGELAPIAASANLTRFYYQNAEYEVDAQQWEEALARFQTEIQAEHDKVVAVVGLHILGTERHESRRIDNQLRGRAGRQGDPGSTRFYLSLEDDHMRNFAQ